MLCQPGVSSTQGWSLHCFSGQLLPLFGCPQWEFLFAFIKPETLCFHHNHCLWYSPLTPMQRPCISLFDDFSLGLVSAIRFPRKPFSSPGWSSPAPPAWRAGQVLQTWTFLWPPQCLLLFINVFLCYRKGNWKPNAGVLLQKSNRER